MKLQARFPFWDLALWVLAAVLLPGNLWAQGNFVYTNDDQPFNTVSAFSVVSNGALTPVPGSPFATGGTGFAGGFFAANRIGVAMAGNFLFASNSVSEDVSAFTINPSTGVLTPVAGSPFATGSHSFSNNLGIAVSPTPDGRFLMAASPGSFNITVFSIGSSGALTPIAGSPFPTLSIPDGIKVSPDGRFLAVAEPQEPPGSIFKSGVEIFRIASNGSLTSLGGVQGLNADGVDIDCSSTFLYVAEAGSSSTLVDGFSIAASGKLTPVPGSPFKPDVGRNSNVVLLSSDDKTLFVTNTVPHNITAFSVAANGSLTLLAGSPFPMNGPATDPGGMATSQDGTLLYVADFPAVVSVFGVGSSGALTEVTGSPFSTGRPEGLLALTAFPPKSCVLTVGIEIKAPALPPVPINPRSNGKIPVAILSTLSFNAVADVDTRSLTFGRTGNEASMVFCDTAGEDINDDGLADLVCHFDTQRSGFMAGDNSAVLKGKTLTGRTIQGQEVIRTVPQ
jgi:6-phosphogluconolactonase